MIEFYGNINKTGTPTGTSYFTLGGLPYISVGYSSAGSIGFGSVITLISTNPSAYIGNGVANIRFTKNGVEVKENEFGGGAMILGFVYWTN